jgi:hypothetical protein
MPFTSPKAYRNHKQMGFPKPVLHQHGNAKDEKRRLWQAFALWFIDGFSMWPFHGHLK